VLFEVKRGESLRAIATRLEQHGLVRDARVTTWWARLRGKAAELHAGAVLALARALAGRDHRPHRVGQGGHLGGG
jgi:cell division protein YceG involved in septum cleavage